MAACNGATNIRCEEALGYDGLHLRHPPSTVVTTYVLINKAGF